jgi:hypothetical protein
MSERFLVPNKGDNKNPPQEKGITRRRFLEVAAAATGLAAAEGVAGAGIVSKLIGANELREVNEKRMYSTGPLQGNTFKKNDLFAFFTGIEGQVPAHVVINFHNQLKALFYKKSDFARRHHKPNVAFKQIEDELLKEYSQKNPERMDMRYYQIKVESTIEEVAKNINWKEVQDRMNLNPDQLKILREITGTIKAKHLTAYALTELMPSSDGNLNRNVYEFLLKSAGSRYIYSIPAIFDDRLSFGPYQFTSGALMDAGNNHPVGASKINCALSGQCRIGGSVSQLRGSDHHKAALLFAIHNLALLIRKLSQKELKNLKNTWQYNVTGITQFIATAHHLPSPAFSSARRWLDAEAKKPFEASCPRSIKKYALKTKANLAAL